MDSSKQAKQLSCMLGWRSGLGGAALLLSLSTGCGGAPGDDTAVVDSDSQALIEWIPPSPDLPLPQYWPICLTCPRTLASGATPTGLTVTSTTVFWSGQRSLGTGGFESGIYSVPTTGGTPTLVQTSGSGGLPPNSVVAGGSALFWQQPGSSGGTWTGAQTGGTATKLGALPYLLANQRQGVATRTTQFNIGSLQLQQTNTLAGDPDNSHLRLFRRSVIGSSTVELLGTSDIDLVGPQPGLYYPDSVALDASNAYFVSYRYGTKPNAVYQMSLAGGTPITIGMADLGSPLALDGSRVYFVRGNSIVSVPIGGGAEETFAVDSGAPTTFAVDGGTLYWTCTSCGTVSKRPFVGGSTTTLASVESAPKFVTVDAVRVYWGVNGAVRYRSK